MINLLFWSILAGLLYRLGGIGADRPTWLRNAPSWLFDSKARDIGVPLCMIAYMSISGHYTHWLWLCFGLMFGAQTSYFKKKGEDAKWYNWLFVGLAFSFCFLPYVFFSGSYVGFWYRSILVTMFTVFWSQFIGKAWLEEFGRGFIQIITLPLLFIN